MGDEELGRKGDRIWIRKSDDVTAHQQDSPDNTDAPKEQSVIAAAGAYKEARRSIHPELDM